MSRHLKRRTYGYFISLVLFLLSGQSIAQVKGEKKDSVDIPLSIRIGVDVFGPAMHFFDKNVLNIEGYVSSDLNERLGLFLGGGYSDYYYTQYNYDYINKGFFVKTGVDLNLLKPEVSVGRYWGGLGIRYGISSFTFEVPSFTQENYWGQASSSLGKTSSWGHYLEISPGFRARLFSNLSMGWSVHLRKLLYTGTGKDLRPIYFPGFGRADKQTSSAISYYLVWNFTYKKIRVKIKADEPPSEGQQQGTPQPGTNQ